MFRNNIYCVGTLNLIILKMGFSKGHFLGLLVYCFQVKSEFGVLIFVEGGKGKDPEKIPLDKKQ